jgi:hypothetical protein
MRRQSRKPGTALVSLVTPALLVVACDNPQSPQTPALTWRGAYDPNVPGRDALTFTLESPSSGFQFVVFAVDFEPATGMLQAEVAIQNTWHRIVQGPAAVGMADFVPNGIESLFTVCDGGPVPIPVPLSPGTTAAGASSRGPGCFIDYRDTYGPEGALYTGESSKRLQWTFLNPAREAFSFRVWLDADGEPRPGQISGVVFADANRNGRRDAGETGIPDAYVGLESGDRGLLGRANHVGRFAYQVGQPGTYRAAPAGPDACPAAMPPERVVTILRGPSGALTSSDRVDFGCAVGGSAPTATVEVSAGGRDRGAPR